MNTKTDTENADTLLPLPLTDATIDWSQYVADETVDAEDADSRVHAAWTQAISGDERYAPVTCSGSSVNWSGYTVPENTSITVNGRGN